MKIEEAISIADTFKSNIIDEELKLKTLNDVECRIMCEVFGGEPEDYTVKTSLCDELSLPLPYTKIYILALLALISLSSGQEEVFLSYSKQYEDAFRDYAKYRLRKR